MPEKGTSVTDCIGFIDCTTIFMNRPGGGAADNHSCYSGNKRGHGLNYMYITTDDGIFLYMYGPQESRRHEITLYRRSGIDEDLQQSLLIAGKQY